MELLASVCPSLEAGQLAEIRALMKSKLPPSNADIAPGLVPNVMTGRIANRLNLKGPNYLLDAACSSSLLAVNAAIDELRSGRSRMMLAGGVNASLPAEVAVIFTQLGALSGRGKVRPFATGSDGTLLGEGLGVVVLKRLADALADGDRIYAVLRGVGQASDGRGHGLLAPSVDGETLAIRRAYDSTGVDPASDQPGRGARHRHSARRQDRDRGAEERVRRAPHRAGRDRARLGQVDDQPLHSGGRASPG